MTREDELKQVKELIKKHYDDTRCGMFFTRNIFSDPMETIFKGDYFTLDRCYAWSYFELFGCTEAEVAEVKEYYEGLREE